MKYDKIYGEPNKFNPDRFMPENASRLVPYAYLPFGAGRRSCIGTRFGLFVIGRSLCHVIARYRFGR
ncbi:unnamed protein product [Oppiella nova]|uniref:Cytochrome P450 n=1 Tax=Oppiella nova TaxID=334625 RepID=A0A7R9LYL0_9ACAR|nr:unnamed protein product [Oppiella nova]CAG2168255.1 unnamed protein product [Oppiella nova]